MITEDYVSFEIAKLLKEKGFCCKKESITAMYGEDGEFYSLSTADPYHFDWGDFDENDYIAPTLQMAMKWLREVYNILLVVDYEYECDTTPYFFKIYRLGVNGKPERVIIKGVSYDKNNNATEHIVGYRDWERSKGDYSTYEQACEAGIKYCLENLI